MTKRRDGLAPEPTFVVRHRVGNVRLKTLGVFTLQRTANDLEDDRKPSAGASRSRPVSF